MAKKADKKQMTFKEQTSAIFKVAKLSFDIAPGAVIFKMFGAVVGALLPIATAFFAALTTTALVRAYNGDAAAGEQAIIYIVITALLGLVGIAWSSIDNYVQANMRYNVESKVSDRMYDKFLNLEFWRYDDKETIDLYDKAQKFAQFFAWIFDRFANISSQIIAMVASIVALLVLNKWLALAVLVAIVPAIYIQFKLSRAQIAHWEENVQTRRAKSMIEWDLLQPQSATELRLYGSVRYLLNLRMKLRDKDEKVRIDFERKFIKKRLVMNLVQTVTEIGALVWVALEIIAQRQPVGQFIYVQQVVSRAINSASGFISELSRIDEDVANLFEYEQFMNLDQPEDRTQKIRTDPENIEFKQVSFRYPKSEQFVLRDVSFSIKKFQHVAIVGENGAGKTTLIKLLAGLYAPTAGQVLLDDVPVDEVAISSWHAKIAILRQDFTKYNFANAGDNVRFGLVEKHDATALSSALTAAEARNFVEKLPSGLDTMLNKWVEDENGRTGVELSGGQWQRLALARNFYRDAPIIILDEPTSTIDALAESRIFDRLFRRKDKTIITISHRLTTVKKADVVYMMQNGQIVEVGTCDELIAKKGEFYKMFKSQI